MDSLLFGIVVFALYFLPTIVGWKHKNINSISMLNLFLGWTFIGWVIAIVWAVSNHKKYLSHNKNDNQYSNINKTKELQSLRQLLNDGTLTEEEFLIQKKILLNS